MQRVGVRERNQRDQRCRQQRDGDARTRQAPIGIAQGKGEERRDPARSRYELGVIPEDLAAQVRADELKDIARGPERLAESDDSVLACASDLLAPQQYQAISAETMLENR
jgi:hypothetical protein